MTAPEIGDHVKVEYEGIVQNVTQGHVSVGATCIALVDHCTVIMRPARVGDFVTREILDQLPDRSLIAGDEIVAWFRRTGCWHYGQQVMTDEEVVARGDQRVLRIGGGS